MPARTASLSNYNQRYLAEDGIEHAAGVPAGLAGARQVGELLDRLSGPPPDHRGCASRHGQLLARLSATGTDEGQFLGRCGHLTVSAFEAWRLREGHMRRALAF